MSNYQEISSFIWRVCDDELRGLFKPHEYGDVILPFVVLRRLDCLIEPHKDEVVSLYKELQENGLDDAHRAGHPSHANGGEDRGIKQAIDPHRARHRQQGRPAAVAEDGAVQAGNDKNRYCQCKGDEYWHHSVGG